MLFLNSLNSPYVLSHINQVTHYKHERNRIESKKCSPVKNHPLSSISSLSTPRRYGPSHLHAGTRETYISASTFASPHTYTRLTIASLFSRAGLVFSPPLRIVSLSAAYARRRQIFPRNLQHRRKDPATSDATRARCTSLELLNLVPCRGARTNSRNGRVSRCRDEFAGPLNVVIRATVAWYLGVRTLFQISMSERLVSFHFRSCS